MLKSHNFIILEEINILLETTIKIKTNGRTLKYPKIINISASITPDENVV